LKDAKIKDLERQLSDAEKSRKELGDEIKLKVKDLDDIKSAIRAKQAEVTKHA
jgi:predicted  nucleic acid-binding Zn-ribbon protein